VDAKIRHLSLAVAQAGMDACPEGHVSMSIGQARCPEDGQDSEELLAQADRRMYGAKQRRTTHALSRGYDFDYVSSTTH
jgi:GGDEF domain-containing protein